MVAIGVLGLDTSHADAFAEIIAENGDASVTAVWDGNDVHGTEYVDRFCERFGASRYDDPREMVDDVDAAMVLTVNWDTHASLAEPFLRAGVPTLVDKPLAGRLSDLTTLAHAAGETPLFGGSAVPYHPDFVDLAAEHAGGALYCVGCNHPFYYGAHLVDLVRTVAGTNWHTVAPATDPGATVDVLFADDTFATVRLDGPGPAANGDRYFLLSTDPARSVSVGFDEAMLGRVYGSYVEEFLDGVRGRADVGDRVLDAGRLLLAAHAALDLGQTVTPNSDELADYHVDGSTFLSGYRS